MSVEPIVTPATAGVSGQESANEDAALNLAEIPASAGMTRVLRRIGVTAAAVAGGLVALDLIGLAATVYFGPELIEAAEAAGLSEMLPK